MESKSAIGDLELGAKGQSDLFSEPSYAQLYVVLRLNAVDPEVKRVDGNEVMFRCGNWCYRGIAQFGDLVMNVKDIPRIIPTLQKQQSNLRYFCNSNAIPTTCDFAGPAQFVNNATNFFASQMISQHIEREINNISKSGMCPWINDDTAVTFFELEIDGPDLPTYMDKVSILASKLYVRGLVVICIYSVRTVYFMLQSGEGDQALLDVRFPDVTRRGQGMHLASYTLNDAPWKKLTLWHLLDTPDLSTSTSSLSRSSAAGAAAADIVKPKTLTISSSNYQQTYCVLRSAWEGVSPAINMYHDALFRFGSWCYTGRVQLTPTIALPDIPFVIPALRLQQSQLDFLCSVDSVPVTSPFAAALDYLQSHEAILEQIIEESADELQSLVERLTSMGLGDAVSKWLDGEASASFFEFKLEPNEATKETFKAVELVAVKSYHASGIVTKSIFYNMAIYVCIEDGSEECPLLDSTFPDVSGKGRGYQIYNYAEGSSSIAGELSKTAPGGGHVMWPELKKVSIWQTVGALEQEFRDRAANISMNATQKREKEAEDERYPQFTSKLKTVAEVKNGTASEMIDGASIADQSTHGMSLIAHPHDIHDNASLSQVSEREVNSSVGVLPSSKGYFPVLDDDKDWTQNTVVSSIADVGTGNIKGSVHGLAPKIYNEGESESSVDGDSKIGKNSDSVIENSSVAEYESVVSGGSYRSMGSIHGGVRGGVGGRGGATRSVTGTGGEMRRDSQGRDIIGSNYQYNSEGFDLVEHARKREHEFVRDTHDRNTADLKALQTNNSTSLSGRINSFVSSYNAVTNNVQGAPKGPAVTLIPQIAESKDGERSLNSDTGSPKNWDTVGRIVEEYKEKQLEKSRSQLLESMAQVQALTQTQTPTQGQGPSSITGGDDAKFQASFHDGEALIDHNGNGNDNDFAHDDLDARSMSTLGAESIVQIGSDGILMQQQHPQSQQQQQQQQQQYQPQCQAQSQSHPQLQGGGQGQLQELGTSSLVSSLHKSSSVLTNGVGVRPNFPKFGGGIPIASPGSLVEQRLGGGSMKAATPHHLPKMTEALSSRLDSIKQTMAYEKVIGAPWDPSGKPLATGGKLSKIRTAKDAKSESGSGSIGGGDAKTDGGEAK